MVQLHSADCRNPEQLPTDQVLGVGPANAGGATCGLSLLGMTHQYSRGSSLIGFVRDDASFIVQRFRGLGAAPPGLR